MAWFSCGCTSLLKNDFAELTLWSSIRVAVEMLPDFTALLEIEHFLSTELCKVGLGSQNQVGFSPTCSSATTESWTQNLGDNLVASVEIQPR